MAYVYLKLQLRLGAPQLLLIVSDFRFSQGWREKGITWNVGLLQSKKKGYWLPLPHPRNPHDPKKALWGWLLGQEGGPVVVATLWINRVNFQDELRVFFCGDYVIGTLNHPILGSEET